MRARFRAVITLVLALLSMPAESRAQQPAVPPPAPCPIAPEEGWTAPEKFVWARVCEGKVADFNAEGGAYIDPRKAPLPDDRILSSEFFETILTSDKYLDAIKRHGLRVTGARFRRALDLQNLSLTSKLWFDGCLFERGADLSWLHTTEPVAFNKSKIVGELTFYGAQIESDLHVIDSVIGRLLFSTARVTRTLAVNHSHVTDQLDMGGLDVGAELAMDDGNYTQVNLRGARIGHTLRLDGSEVTHGLQMDSLQAGVYLHLRKVTVDAINLLGARVQNQVSFDGAKVGHLAMFDLQVGTDVWMDNAEFSDTVNLQQAQIGGQLRWNGSTFHNGVDLSGARVGGELQLAGTRWDANATLTARYAKIGILPRLSDPWPDKVHVFGLTYDGIAESGDDFRPWFARQDRYARQPYQQLANVLQARGDIERATEVRVAERERDRSERQGVIFAWLTLLKYLIGYGYYPYYSLWWVGGFVALGMFVLWVSGEGRRNRMPIGFAYSFDMLLPAIQLRDQHYEIDLRGWPRYYFYVHRIMGWVLASFLVAGLSGLTK